MNIEWQRMTGWMAYYADLPGDIRVEVWSGADSSNAIPFEGWGYRAFHDGRNVLFSSAETEDAAKQAIADWWEARNG